MDPPPLPPLPTSSAIAPATIHLSYPDSVESSPRSHTANTFNEPLPHIPGAKLRLMCSYGGHIIPRPHDKTLCFVGGETRMVAIDRHSSLSSLTSCLSRTLLNGRPFTLKYQLPHEDLDSLVSVTTDEDLDNMIEEYDRINASCSTPMTPHRIRLFLFFNKPETAASMGSLLDDAKSETWFVDALNGSLLPRNLSDTAAINCLVNLDSDVHDLEAQAEGEMIKQEIENVTRHHDLVQDYHSSSSSSPPSMCHLPPIKVRLEDHLSIGVEEQFAQMSFAQVVQKQDDHGYNNNGLMPAAALPPLPPPISAVGMVASLNPSGDSSENLNRILSDDERSDHGTPVSSRKKPPLPLQPVQHKPGGYNFNLPSPDSVKSDTSIASANSLSKPMCYQEQIAVNPDSKSEISIPSSQIQIQHKNSGFLQFDQQQYIQSNSRIIPHTVTTPLPNISSYYPIYSAQPSQQPHQPMDHHQQYPVYVMPVAQTQPYMLGDTATVIAPGRATPPAHPPVYPTTNTLAMPETAASVYRTAVPSTPSFVPIPATQFQQQYVGYAQMQHPSQSIAVASAANYGFECGKGGTSDHQQVYYTQVQAASLPPEYQSMSPAAVVALAEASSNQLPTTNTIHQIGNSQSQPL